MLVYNKAQWQSYKGGAVVSTLANGLRGGCAGRQLDPGAEQRLDLSDHQISLDGPYLHLRSTRTPSQQPTLDLKPRLRWSSRPCLILEEDSKSKHLQDEKFLSCNCTSSRVNVHTRWHRVGIKCSSAVLIAHSCRPAGR